MYALRVRAVNYFNRFRPANTRARAHVSHSIYTCTSRTRVPTIGACYNVLISMERARHIRKIVNGVRNLRMNIDARRVAPRAFRYKGNIISLFGTSFLCSYNALRYSRYLRQYGDSISDRRNVYFKNITGTYDIPMGTHRIFYIRKYVVRINVLQG
jgi:hypothetical protein